MGAHLPYVHVADFESPLIIYYLLFIKNLKMKKLAMYVRLFSTLALVHCICMHPQKLLGMGLDASLRYRLYTI